MVMALTGIGQQPPAFVRKAGWPDLPTALPIVLDVDNDGVPEYGWAGVSTAGPVFTYRRLLGSRTWAQGPSLLLPGLPNVVIGYAAMLAADFNGDGNVDVLLDRWGIPLSGGSVQHLADTLLLGDGRGSF